jgi:hypothetical protein
MLVLNPRTDPEFVALTEGLTADAMPSPDAFQRALRERFPHAVVRPRDLASEAMEIWYVYRDGHWTRPDDALG